MDGTQGNVIVCTSNADPGLVARIKGGGPLPNVVVKKPDGSYDSRQTDRPIFQESTSWCDVDAGGGPGWLFQLRDPNVDFISQDLSAAFVSGFIGKRFSCDGGFELSGLDFDVQGFRIEHGTLRRPDVTLRLEGDSESAVTAHCSLSGSTGIEEFQAGPVPVLYELELSIGLTVAISKSTHTHVSATIGTTGGSLTTDDPTISITPSIELGVNFYGLVGASIGVGFPITVSPAPPCPVTLGVDFKVGAEVGLIGFKEFPIEKALSVERTTTLPVSWQIGTLCN